MATIGWYCRDDKGMIDITFVRPIGDVPIHVMECMAICFETRLAKVDRFEHENGKQLETAIPVSRSINGEVLSLIDLHFGLRYWEDCKSAQ